MENNEILKTCYTKAVEAYMGGTGYEGSNSNCGLYGSDLTARFREIAKACKIKGVTFSSKRCSSITVKVKVTEADFVPYEQIADQIERPDFLNINMGGWRRDPKNPERYICSDEYWNMSVAEKKAALKFWAKDWYESSISGGMGCICHGWQLNEKDYPCFNANFFDRWNALTKIVSSHNWNKSNAQVDYFDVNFYEHWEIIKK